MAARQQWPERSWEMRWYRQHACQLIRDERPDLVAFADEEVVDVAHRRDARVREGGAELVGRTELVVLRGHDERTVGDPRQRARGEAHVLRADTDERDRVGAPASLEKGESLERAEAVSHQTQRQTRCDGARVLDRGGDVVGLVAAAGPLAGARADAAEVEAKRVPAALGAGPRDRGHDRRSHRAAVRRQSVGDYHDRRRGHVGYPQRRLEPVIDPPRFLAHVWKSAGTAATGSLYRLARCGRSSRDSACSLWSPRSPARPLKVPDRRPARAGAPRQAPRPPRLRRRRATPHARGPARCASVRASRSRTT